jgi:hypothetical protein
MARVDRRNPDECWPWLSYTDRKGYGRFSWGTRPIYRVRATRAMYQLVYGPEDIAGKVVCHTCDNPRCVNPAHLWLGTAEDNVADKVAKDRQACGEAHGCSKLSARAVEQIRKSDLGSRELARHFGVHRTTVQRIRNGNLWKGVAA